MNLGGASLLEFCVSVCDSLCEVRFHSMDCGPVCLCLVTPAKSTTPGTKNFIFDMRLNVHPPFRNTIL